MGGSGEAAPAPREDSGLLGPTSVAWRIHGDFTAMMIGGVSALLLQMLHPAAVAGVCDHSNFREDMPGRLKRTARFVGVTTFGSTEAALQMIARVRAVHERVTGVLPDGRPYAANDPALLTFVHVAEMLSFLAAYRRYCDPDLSSVEQDRYFAETALIARQLGAADVPVTCREVEAYMSAIRPSLRFDRRTGSVARALLGQPASSPALEPFRDLTFEAGIELLPSWAAQMHGFDLSERRRRGIRAGVAGVGAMLRWALRDEVGARAT